jgi:hypothetical protein
MLSPYLPVLILLVSSAGLGWNVRLKRAKRRFRGCSRRFPGFWVGSEGCGPSSPGGGSPVDKAEALQLFESEALTEDDEEREDNLQVNTQHLFG